MAIKVIIEMKDNGIIELTGPLENKALIYALLKGAEEIMREYPKNKKSIGSGMDGMGNLSSGSPGISRSN